MYNYQQIPPSINPKKMSSHTGFDKTYAISLHFHKWMKVTSGIFHSVGLQFLLVLALTIITFPLLSNENKLLPDPNTVNHNVFIDSLINVSNNLIPNQPQEATRIALKAVKLSEQEGNMQKIVKSRLNLAEVYKHQRNFSALLVTLNPLLPALNELNNDTLAADILNNIGIAHFQLRHDTIPLRAFIKGLEKNRSENELDSLSGSLKSIGKFYSSINNYERAADFFIKSAAVDSINQNDYELGISWFYLGKTAFSSANQHLAIPYFEAALPFLQDIMKAKVFLYLAKYYFDKQLALSDEYVRKADSINHNYSDLDIHFEILLLSAKISTENKEYNKAYAFLEEAKNMDYQYAEPLAESYVFIGNKLLGDKNYALAISSFSEVINQNHVSYFIKSKAALGLADSYKISGDKAKENEMLRIYVALMDSNLTEALENEKKRINSPLNNQNLERKIDLYQKDSKIQNLIIEKEKAKKTNFIALVLILTPMLFFILLLYRDRTLANKKLKDQNLQINQQVDELSEMVNCLSLSKQQLQEANNTKEKLFSIVAHDLKSPLISLKTLLYSLNSEVPNQPNLYQQQLRDVEKNLNTIIDLLNNLLFWALSQKEAISVLPQEFNLHNTAETDLLLAQNIANQKNILIRNEIPPDLKIVTDKNMYLFVLRNLLSNALKFTPSQGEILLSIEEDKNGITLIVKDTGPGIEMEKQSSIFDLVKPVKSEKNSEEGTGLGMPLSQEFAKKMGGTLTVKSSPGQGSRFMLAMPGNLIIKNGNEN